MKFRRILMFSFVAFYSMNSAAADCKFKSMKSEIKGDQRIISRCRGASDCEVVASLKPEDVKRFETMVAENDQASEGFLIALTLGAGGAVFTGTKLGGMIGRYVVGSAKNFVAPLTTSTGGVNALPPAAGLLKAEITKTYGAKAAEIFSRSTYPATFGAGGIAITVPNISGKLSAAAKAVTGPSDREKTTASHIGAKLPETTGGEDADSCVDKQIAHLEEIMKLLNTKKGVEDKDSQCSAMALGRDRARCLHDLRKQQQQFFLDKNFGSNRPKADGTR